MMRLTRTIFHFFKINVEGFFCVQKRKPQPQPQPRGEIR